MEILFEKKLHRDRPLRESVSRTIGAWGSRALRCLPADHAQDLSLWLLRKNVMSLLSKPSLDEIDIGLSTTVPGVGDLMHPIGLAAGLDRNASHLDGLAQLGFSFMEIGTVAPLPWERDEGPRLRLMPEQMAVVQRAAGASLGAPEVCQRIRGTRWSGEQIPLGINLGSNPATPFELMVEDLVAGMQTFAPAAQYFVFNLPIQQPDVNLVEVQYLVNHLAERVPHLLSRTWLKLGPGLRKKPFQELVCLITECGFQGIIVGHSQPLSWPEVGAVAGHPVSVASTTLLEWAYEAHGGRLMMIAAGGILSGKDVFEKLARGALAVQIYSALIYRGPYAVIELLEELIAELKMRGFSCVQDCISTHFL